MNEVKKEIMHVGEMASGAALTVPVYRLKGDPAAPSVYIQANMHCAEVQGNAVIFQLLELLKNTNINGDITLVPYANPVGCNHKNGEYNFLESQIYTMCVVCVGGFFFLMLRFIWLYINQSQNSSLKLLTHNNAYLG